MIPVAAQSKKVRPVGWCRFEEIRKKVAATESIVPSDVVNLGHKLVVILVCRRTGFGQLASRAIWQGDGFQEKLADRTNRYLVVWVRDPSDRIDQLRYRKQSREVPIAFCGSRHK